MRTTQILRTRSDIAEIIRNSSEEEIFSKLTSPPEIEERLSKIDAKLESFNDRFSSLEIGLTRLLLIAENGELATAKAPKSKPEPKLETPKPTPAAPELKIEPTAARYCPENADVDAFVSDTINVLKQFELTGEYAGFNKVQKAWIINVQKPLNGGSFGTLSISKVADMEEDEPVGSLALRHQGEPLEGYGLYNWEGDDLDLFTSSAEGEDLFYGLQKLDRFELKPELTPSQTAAIATLKEWFKGSEKEAALIGPAGTGKSFSLKALIEELNIELKEISLLAPTHKARKILEASIGADASTVAQALGQQPKLDENGQEIFEGKGDKSNSKLTIIDEASMVNAEDYSELVSLNQRILWVGDRYQLPPVKEKKSLAFESPSVRTQAELTEVVRYTGAIARFCEQLRSGDLFLPEPDGETLFLLDKKEWKQRAVEEAQAQIILDDSTASKVLAFTNRTVNSYNQYLKKAVFPNQKEPFFNGLKLVCNSPIQRLEYVSVGRGKWSKEELLWRIKATNSEEIRITSEPRIKTLTLDDFDEEPKIFIEWVSGWQIWEFEAETEGFLDITCRVLTPKFEKVKEAKIKELGGDNYRRLSSAEKNGLKCLYRYFDKVADVFASTTHKAQGSGYDNVFVDWSDLISARDMKEQLIYTACTRAKKRLFICKN